MNILSVENQNLLTELINNIKNEMNINIDNNTLNNFLYSKCIYYNNTNPNGDIMKLNKMILSDVHTYLLNNSKNINNFNNNNQKHVKIN